MLDFKQSYFTLFGLNEDFTIDKTQLANAFRTLQAQYHPDRFVDADEAQQRIALQSTEFINEAQQTLLSDRLRARYLLTRNGVTFDDEIDTTSDGAFLMQQMELREALEEAQQHDDAERALDAVDEISKQVRQLQQQVSERFVSDFTDNDFVNAKQAVLKMKFFERLNNEVKAASEKLEDEWV